MNVNKWKGKIKTKLLDIGLGNTNLVTIDAKELADLRIRAANASAKPVEPLSREHLTMKQLGSYLPNFEVLANKDDAFKNAIGMLCRNLMLDQNWQYLITHLKQDQVNLSLFGEERKDDNWVRGSINGIYVVDDQINMLGRNYEQRLKSGTIDPKAEKPK
jgi:hypothetical protein